MEDQTKRHDELQVRDSFVVSVLISQFITAQKIIFSVKDFFIICDQIRRKLWTWSHLLKKSLIEKVIFCTVQVQIG